MPPHLIFLVNTARGPVSVERGFVNEAIVCGGVPVRPHDLVLADADGVVVIPRGEAAYWLARSREKLSRSRNERESNAAQRELEELRKLQRDREDEINKLSTLSESARKSIEETEAAQKKIADELGGRESDISKTLAEAMKERDAKLVDRGKLAAAVQPMTLRRYEQVRKRKGSAIAKTIDGTCLACHMRLPPMLFQKLMRGDAFEQCPSCARILYYEAPQDERDGGTR